MKIFGVHFSSIFCGFFYLFVYIFLHFLLLLIVEVDISDIAIISGITNMVKAIISGTWGVWSGPGLLWMCGGDFPVSQATGESSPRLLFPGR